jgi:hypothetical protein
MTSTVTTHFLRAPLCVPQPVLYSMRALIRWLQNIGSSLMILRDAAVLVCQVAIVLYPQELRRQPPRLPRAHRRPVTVW